MKWLSQEPRQVCIFEMFDMGFSGGISVSDPYWVVEVRGDGRYRLNNGREKSVQWATLEKIAKYTGKTGLARARKRAAQEANQRGLELKDHTL